MVKLGSVQPLTSGTVQLPLNVNDVLVDERLHEGVQPTEANAEVQSEQTAEVSCEIVVPDASV